MTDKGFRWNKIKKTFIKILTVFVVFWVTVWAIDFHYGKVDEGYKKGVTAGYHTGHFDGYKEGSEDERSKCEKGGGDYLMGFMMGLKQGLEEGFYQGETNARTECDESVRVKCDNILPDTGALVKKVLTSFHPGHFPKNLDDVKDLYYNATNFYDLYLK